MTKRFGFTTIKSSLFREDLGGYQLFSDSKVETHPLPLPNHGGEKRVAFTLAEVLITLAIIGVVATMTIPTLIANYNQKSWDTATSVFNRRLGEALKIMNANGSLAGYNSTEDFVTELSKHIKIVKTCDNTNLTDCFVSEIVTNAEPIETSKLKKSKNLNSAANPDYGTDTMGIMFADGVSALIAYNKNTPYDPYSNKIVRVSGNNKSATLNTGVISILYDVNGLKSPNEMDNDKDIRGINITLKTKITVKNLGTVPAVNCANSASEGYDYCGINDKNISDERPNNYWVGAKYACAKEGMRIPTLEELQELNENKGQDEIPTTGWFWSTFEYSATIAHGFSFDAQTEDPSYKDREDRNVLCIAD